MKTFTEYKKRISLRMSQKDFRKNIEGFIIKKIRVTSMKIFEVEVGNASS